LEIDDLFKWQDCLNNSFNKMIGNDSWGIFVYEDTKIEFFEFEDFKDLNYFLNSIEFK
jgi:hypothetical protein